MIPVSEPNISDKEAEYVLDAVRSTYVSSFGPYLDRFEHGFAEYVGARHALAVCNGTVALQLALVVLDLAPGDEVIVPNITFIASANMVRQCGAVPVLADVDPATWNIAPESIERLITPRTRAIMPVHLYGNPCDMDAIAELANRHGLVIVEDAAEAIGARFRGRHVGTLGRIGTFSFYGNKTITTGEGGIVVTDDSALAERMRMLKSHGMSSSRKYWFDHAGFNFRMTNVQAALGCAQLERITTLVATKQRNAELYDCWLAPEFGRVREQPHGEHSYWMYSPLVPIGVDRDRFAAILREQQIDTRPLFYPLSDMPPYRDARHELSAAARQVAARGITLPSSTRLSEEQIRTICEVANRALRT
jgi:perosamine synthetase